MHSYPVAHQRMAAFSLCYIVAAGMPQSSVGIGIHMTSGGFESCSLCEPIDNWEGIMLENIRYIGGCMPLQDS